MQQNNIKLSVYICHILSLLTVYTENLTKFIFQARNLTMTVNTAHLIKITDSTGNFLTITV